MLNKLKLLSKNAGALKIPSSLTRNIYNIGVTKNYNQVKDLNQVMYTAELEEEQRKAKYLEYTHKVYKPSKTITFDRNGEVLLFSVDNFRNSQVYLKYPYCLIDSFIPLGFYIFFVNPLNFNWIATHTIFHTAWILGWMPHYLYIRSLSKKIHKIYLMRGGKYCRIQLMDWMGYTTNTWITNKEVHLLTDDYKRFADEEKFEFLTTQGQLKFELGVQLDNFIYYGYNHNDDVIYFMKEGLVHEPELFEQTMRGYNIDTSDFEVNTEDNIRWMEPTKNY